MLDTEAMFPEGPIEETRDLAEEIKQLIPAVEDACKRAYILHPRHDDVGKAITADLDAITCAESRALAEPIEGWALAYSLSGWYFQADALNDPQAHVVAATDDCVSNRTVAWYDEIKAQHAPAPVAELEETASVE